MSADVLANADERAVVVEHAGCVQTAGERERRLRLPQSLRERGEQRPRHAPLRLDGRRVDGNRLSGTLAADAARGRGVEVAPQPLEVEGADAQLDRVRGEVGGQGSAERLQAFADREPERQLLVVPGCAHRDGDRFAADANLERLLYRDQVVLARAARTPRHPDGCGRARHPLGRVGSGHRRATLARLRASDNLSLASKRVPAVGQTPGMLRRAGLLVLLTLCAAGCSIDRVEWESTGFVVEEVEHRLVEEHHAADPVVECIKREVGGAVWECRAHDGEAAFECEVKAGPREVIHEVECDREHEEEPADREEGAPAEPQPAEEDAPAEH